MCSLDEKVIPMVKFFNKYGLRTYMSCQGHNNTNQSMFWIQFDKSVTKEDILNFMHNHLNVYGQFCSNGRFAKRVFGFYDVRDQSWKCDECYNYFAATVEAANEDLQSWMNDTDVWKGVDGKEYQKLVKQYERNKN